MIQLAILVAVFSFIEFSVAVAILLTAVHVSDHLEALAVNPKI